MKKHVPLIARNLASRYRPFRRRTKPGARPGLVKSEPDAEPTRIHVIQYDAEQVVEREVESVEDLAEYRDSEGVCWVNVDGLADGRCIRAIGEMFGLHPLALEDVVHVHQRSKVEDYPGHLFIVARMVSLSPRLESEQITLFLGKHCVITFQERQGDCLEPVRERIRRGRGLIRQAGADYLCYALIDAIIDAYFPVVEAYGDQLADLETTITQNGSQEAVGEVFRIRSDLLMLRRIIWPHREAIAALIRSIGNDDIRPETQVYLRDCQDHVTQILEVTESYRELCSDLRELHYANLSQRSNEVMQVLTVIATIFIPLSFIASLYGMNFDTRASEYNMPELEWKYGYPFALGLMGLVVAALLFFFWRRGWLSR